MIEPWWNWSSSGTSTTQTIQDTSASTSTTLYFSSWITSYDCLPELIWSFPKYSSVDLAPQEKSVHGRVGKKYPKPQTAKRGYRPKVSQNFYHKDRY